MSKELDAILKHRCPSKPGAFMCEQCGVYKAFKQTKESCIAINRFIDYCFSEPERSIKSASIYNRTPKENKRNRALDFMAAWLYMCSATGDEITTIGLANALENDNTLDYEPYSKWNRIDRNHQSYLSKIKGTLWSYVLTFAVSSGINDSFDCSSMLTYFVYDVAPQFFPMVNYSGNYKTFSCLTARQTKILKCLVDVFNSPVSTEVINRRTKEPVYGGLYKSFKTWEELIEAKPSLLEKYRFTNANFIRYFMDINSMNKHLSQSMNREYIEDLKEKEIRYLLQFDNLKYYTNMEIRYIGFVGNKRSLPMNIDEDIKIFKLLRKK